MAKNGLTNNRLPRNFHNTFVPERKYINAMLKFAAKGGAGDIQTIGADTGIPEVVLVLRTGNRDL